MILSDLFFPHRSFNFLVLNFFVRLFLFYFFFAFLAALRDNFYFFLIPRTHSPNSTPARQSFWEGRAGGCASLPNYPCNSFIISRHPLLTLSASLFFLFLPSTASVNAIAPLSSLIVISVDKKDLRLARSSTLLALLINQSSPL